MLTRDGHRLAHESKFGTNFGWFRAQEVMFREDACPEHLPNFSLLVWPLWVVFSVWSSFPFLKLWLAVARRKGGGKPLPGQSISLFPGCRKGERGKGIPLWGDFSPTHSATSWTFWTGPVHVRLVLFCSGISPCAVKPNYLFSVYAHF